jgi:dimeric dUTPase (all-alpha-NTP-PPase superfamily)
LSYKTDRLTIEIPNLLVSKDNLKEKFLDVFKVGDRYTNKSIKEAVRLIYEEFGLKKSPKATDINEYFETSAINVLMPDKTYVHGLKILSVKE